MADITLINTDKIKIVCPFRTLTITTQSPLGELRQLIEFPECQYAQCPFYDEKAEAGKKCLQAEKQLGC